MKDQIKNTLIKTLSAMGINVDPVVESPVDFTHGDYTTNVAMVVAKRLKRNPLDIAYEIKNQLIIHNSQLITNAPDHFTNQSGQKGSALNEKMSVLQDIDKVEVVPPGFINFHLAASSLINILNRVLNDKEGFGKAQFTTNKRIMVEFAHPNTHKAFHIGHLRNITTGESIVRLLESEGHEVIRANYQGDVGMHIAKAIYALLQILKFKDKVVSYSSSEARSSKASSQPSASNNKLLHERVELLGQAYAAGSKAFDESDEVKKEVG
ncbi:MAG: arginine--tRNA ligase, partial [Patescibacteria group bacterium]